MSLFTANDNRTPLQNDLGEMWSLLHWLLPDVFPDKSADLFKRAFDVGRGMISLDMMDHARRLLELLMLRRMKSSPSVNLGLPPKTDVMLFVPLTPLQREWYTRLLQKVDTSTLDVLFTDMKEKEIAIKHNMDEGYHSLAASTPVYTPDDLSEGEQKYTGSIEAPLERKTQWQYLMNLLMQLRKCCSHPYLFADAMPKPYYFGDHIRLSSAKLIVLEKLLQELIIRRKEKVLVFSGFTGTLDWCEDVLTLMGCDDKKPPYRYIRLDGSTATARRNLNIRLFNSDDSDYRLMLISTKAGGLGLNLTSASNVIFLDSDWNPQNDIQAEARAHRIGQTRPVTVYKICTQGTVEEQMLSRINKKMYLSARVTESMRDIYASSNPLKRKRADAFAQGESSDMPQLGTTQLMSVLRRGATTLTNTETSVEEMDSWSFDTMLAKCKSAQPAETDGISTEDQDEAAWLAKSERVELAILDGVKYQRAEVKTSVSEAHLDLDRAARRVGKHTTVNIGGYEVSKESIGCADWEAVPTLAGKDPRLAEPVRAKKDPIIHQKHCHVCKDTHQADIVDCQGCPRIYHRYCLSEEMAIKSRGMGFRCPQHQCWDCEKKTAQAGGMLYRCRWCQGAWCQDCLDWDNIQLLGETVEELELLGFGANHQAWWIVCEECCGHVKEEIKVEVKVEE